MKTSGLKYDIPKGWTETYEGVIDAANDSSLEQWAADPNCVQSEQCAAELAKRRTRKIASDDAERNRLAAERNRVAERRERLEASPFDPGTEVSADAKRIVANLWIIFVLLPVVLGLLYSILK